jgi:spore germination protein YaaH
LYRIFKKAGFAILCITLLLAPCPARAVSNAQTGFADVPVGSWAYGVIHEAREKNLTQGIGNNVFGYGMTVKRSEFVKFLVSLMGWDLTIPDVGSFDDNLDKNKWYYEYIETAVQHGVVLKDEPLFRPDDDITREDMAIMIARSLGYDALGKKLDFLEKPFADVVENAGYITIVKDLGIVNGKIVDGHNLFEPESSAKREEAVAMLMRMYTKLSQPIEELHAFYAIRSYQQRDMIGELDSVSFGWSSLDYDSTSKQVFINTTQLNNNEFYIPEASSEVVELAKNKNVSTQLNVFASQEKKVPDGNGDMTIGIIEFVLKNPDVREKIIDEICVQLDKGSFDGVVIDFECMRGETLKQQFNEFLIELRSELKDKNLYVAVHPGRAAGQSYYDGYDYRTIGTIADKVILMAHDYNAAALTPYEMSIGYNDTPLSPIDEIYYALKFITDKDTGVEDLSKIWLQISFDAVQWKKLDGKVINQTAYRPDYGQIYKRLTDRENTENLKVNFHRDLKYSWLTFHNNADKTENIIWYEDSRSVSAKVQLSKLFGIRGISLWRLGNVPDFEDAGFGELNLDVWQKLLEMK